MNILILNWRDPGNPLSGGAEIVTMRHAEGWVSRGHGVTWFTSRFPGAKPQETVKGVEIVRRGSIYTVHLRALPFYLFSGKKFDIVIDEIHGLPFFTPLYVRGPKIAFIHEVAGEIWDYMSFFPLNKAGKLLERLYFYLYRGVPFWTDAHSTVDELVRYGIDRKQCVAIPCPPMTRALPAVPGKEKRPAFIFVSRLVKMKGVESVIRAFAGIRTRATLWIVGEGEEAYVGNLKRLVRRLGCGTRVRFWGKVSERQKLHLMSRAHLLLHASVKEGWGLVVTEAAAMGTPAIVYNVNGLRDSVQNGATGVVLAKNTPEEMARQIDGLMDDPVRYRRYQKNCLQETKTLSWDRVTRESTALLARTAHSL
ncbi:glycosyltransferase family 4 protein [Patescibacteria group bacterium]|nr:glycosyltransferase family 4 protein [Patescibacteria group bacterium]